MPGIVFLLANAVWGLVPATMAALASTVLAIVLRYRIDAQLPYLAIAAVSLSVTLLAASIVLNDAQFIKLRPTISGVAFALILFLGAMARPSLLERSLGYKIVLLPAGWWVLHFAWGGLALAFAALNEVVWRNASTDVWVAYGVAIDPIALALFWGAAWVISWYYWDEE